VDALIDRAFGPGRFTKVSERVRERAAFRQDLSMCAFEDGRLIGCARMWDVTVGGIAAAFLGPLAVEASARSGGVGAALVDAAARAAQAAGVCAVVLVGDEAYFGRVGFSAARTAKVLLPGPVDQRRVLSRWLAAGEPATLEGPLV
jgi:predicted N-acetyltransferase YhbS